MININCINIKNVNGNKVDIGIKLQKFSLKFIIYKILSSIVILQSTKIKKKMKILKVIFIVDKDRRFTFDNITLKNLTKMIIEAANIGNIGLRIYKNIIECIQKENETLDFLFPNL